MPPGPMGWPLGLGPQTHGPWAPWGFYEKFRARAGARARNFSNAPLGPPLGPRGLNEKFRVRAKARTRNFPNAPLGPPMGFPWPPPNPGPPMGVRSVGLGKSNKIESAI